MDRLRQEKDKNAFELSLQRILKEFVKTGAPSEVNLSDVLRRETEEEAGVVLDALAQVSTVVVHISPHKYYATEHSPRISIVVIGLENLERHRDSTTIVPEKSSTSLCTGNELPSEDVIAASPTQSAMASRSALLS